MLSEVFWHSLTEEASHASAQRIILLSIGAALITYTVVNFFVPKPDPSSEEPDDWMIVLP
jgi:hypothetical protein